jgi:hypothetical protein
MLVSKAINVPKRPLNVSLHEYIAKIRETVNGKDAIGIPDSHRGLLRNGENHEASVLLDYRIRQLASWFSRAKPLFSAKASGPGQTVQRGSSVMEQFVRAGETEFRRGKPMHNYEQECNRDLAECGWSAFLQIPRKDYYDSVVSYPERMAEGAALTDIAMRRRIDPATLSIEEKLGGELGAGVITTQRQLGELALKVGLENASRILGYLDISEAIDVTDPNTWDESVTIAEVWGDENGGLVFMNAGNLKAGVDVSKLPASERVIAEWQVWGECVPLYIAKVGPQPWYSPLDRMFALTNARNYWATMQDIQASGAIFRHWQLIESATGNDITNMPGRDPIPEKFIYNPAEPPPDMGEGTEWKLAPFEFHDVLPRYTQIMQQHEAAGASVARLMGEVVNQNTPVGTADFMDESATDEFGDWLEAKQNQMRAAWIDLLRYLRDYHKDPVFVADKKRDRESNIGALLSVAVSIVPSDIVTEDLDATLDSRSALSKLRDYRYFCEARNNGDMDFSHGVELGLIPGVEDADDELLSIYIGHLKRVGLESKVALFQRDLIQNATPDQPSAPPQAPPTNVNIAGGARSDPRGTGTGRGPDNISDSALAAGATDMARAS